MNGIRIQLVKMDQAPQIAALCDELGYPSSAGEVRQRLEYILENSDHAVFVAVNRDDVLLGWVHAYEVRLLTADRFAEVGGLIVSKGNQKRGVGTLLMNKVETWASERDLPMIRLRSNIQRGDAHQFYQSIGYTIEKTSHTLTKNLSG